MGGGAEGMGETEGMGGGGMGKVAGTGELVIEKDPECGLAGHWTGELWTSDVRESVGANECDQDEVDAYIGCCGMPPKCGPRESAIGDDSTVSASRGLGRTARPGLWPWK